ncbi:hypothetical protein ACOMHN_046412 [Nucella lapillus]
MAATKSYADTERMMARKRFCFRACADTVCAGLVAGPVLLINLTASPFHRGFFCDDQSLIHPFKDDTVPTWFLVLVGMGLPLICILLVECLLQRTTRCCVLVPTDIPLAPKSYAECSYRTIIVFFFGAAITQLLTEIGKYSIGRLRPHFLTVCQPENIPANCSGMFITEHVCTGGYDETVMKQARLSFPSGHASMSMFSATFIMLYLQARLVCSQAKLLRPALQLNLYLQARLVCSQAKLLRPALQVGVFCLAFFTCLSRVSDYKHHWSDVLSGAVLGVAVCYLVMASLGDFHRLTLRKPWSTLSGSRKERLPMYRKDNNSSTSSDLPNSASQDTIQVHVENQKM